MTNLFLVMGGGAVGAGLRYQLGRFAGHMAPGATWPWATFAANLIGGFAMGLLAGWLARASPISGEPVRLLLGVGVLGGFTTFSAFSLETMALWQRAHWEGVAYVGLTLILGLAAFWLGMRLSSGA